MKLAIVIPILNQFDLAATSLDYATALLGSPADVIAIDNASDSEFKYEKKITETHEQESGVYEASTIKVIRLEKNIGVYPIFWEALKHTDADIIALFHSDVILSEKNWDQRVLQAFEENPKLGLLGFIGSDEIDSSGGRGLGTISNFQGNRTERHKADGSVKSWTGSPAEAHGRRNAGLTPAAVVDGCVMIFRRQVLERIPQRPDFPLHHFYDRLLSCEVREIGDEVAVLGIAFDHISGQTVNQETAYDTAAREWAEAHGLTMEGVHNWDSVLYREAEKQWLREYKNIKQLVPCKIS